MNKKALLVTLIVLVSFFLLLGCTNINQIEDNEYNEFLNDADLNIVDDRNNGNVFSNLDEFIRVRAGDNVSVHYKGTLVSGEIFDSSYDRGSTLDFVAGGGQMIKGFDEAIIGMRVGEKKTIQIPPEEAYGELNEKVIYIDRNMFVDDQEIEVGMIFQAGPSQVEIVYVEDNNIGVIENHPLAGQTLIFDIELVSIN